MVSSTPQRDTIALEDAEVLSHQAHPGQQYVLRVRAPRTAARAQPGGFVHLRCADWLPMRRPLSIMRADPREGWVELLYKVVGVGTRELSRRRAGERLSILGPIGNAFVPDADRPRRLLIGGGVGIPPMVFLAERLRGDASGQPALVLMGSEAPFPLALTGSRLPVAGMPAPATAGLELLDSWGVPSRLASTRGYSGCFPGYVTELAAAWLAALEPAALRQVQVFACGPLAMLEAVARLAQTYDLPCQVSLEEFMACAVGGCAGCAVEVLTDAGPAMKRVCVDGPVFDARRVFSAA
jgi:dihydroorotate dehydrogenase electron transfer subunit